MSEVRPTSFGAYRVLEVLGEGSMGVVYKVIDQRERFYALKTLKPDTGETVRKRFLREISICEDLLHPNIAIPHDAALEPVPFLVFEYLSGRPLSLIIDEGMLLDHQAIALLIEQLGDGLRYLHDLGISHGDLNPGNIIVTRDHRGEMLVKILDLGVAKSEATNVRLGDRFRVRGCNRPPTLKGLFGTPGYIAPELFKNPRATPRSDQFALGAMAYEMVLGVNPFPGEGPVRTMSPPEITPVVPEMGQLFEQVLNQDPTRRFTDVSEFIAAFLPLFRQERVQQALQLYHRFQRQQSRVRYLTTHQLLTWEEQDQPALGVPSNQRTYTLEQKPRED